MKFNENRSEDMKRTCKCNGRTDGRTFSRKDSFWAFTMLEKVANKAKKYTTSPLQFKDDEYQNLMIYIWDIAMFESHNMNLYVFSKCKKHSNVQVS